MHAKHGAFDTLSRLVDLKNDLHKWWDALPDSVCRKDSVPSSSSSQSSVKRSEMHLRLEYCLVRMFTGRPFIFLRVPSRSNASSSSSPAEQAHLQRPASSPRKTDSRSILVADCVEAALTIVDTCKIIRNSIGLARASYTEFSACRAALLVIITQCLQGKTDRLRQSLKDGVAMIKVMSAGGESARSEASLIEVLERAIARLDAPEDANLNSGAENDYARFKKWEMLWKNDSPSSGQAGNSSGRAMPDTPGPMPPPPLMTGLWSGGGAGVGALGRSSGVTPMQGMTPSGAMDWNFASFPQTMDEFSSMFGQGFGPSPDSMGGSGPGNVNMWMGP